MVKKLTIKYLLENIEELKIDKDYYWLMAPDSIVDWSEDTPCILATTEECEKFGDVYKEPYNSQEICNSFITSINVDDIEDIFDILSQQISNPTINQKINAVIYYINNDAFIDIKNEK